MAPTVLIGAIRAGCTHLILDALVSSEEQQRLAKAERFAAAVQHLCRPACWPDQAVPPDCLVS